MIQDHFEKLQTLMATRAGMRLARDRMQLAEHRLAPVARREGFETVEAMLAALWAKPVASLGWAVIEAMLSAETWFRRDRAPFDTFKSELLPAIAAARPEGLVRVWSAGCATGQEAYSLAIAALEADANAEIVATDLSQRALEKAKSGVFSAFEIQRGLSAATMLRWFDQVEDQQWQAKPELRAAVRFARVNLLDEVADATRFDVIFCRHVLSEMDQGRRGQVIDGLERRLVDDGCLVLGPNERLDGDTVAFRAVGGRMGLFVKAPSAISRAA